MTILDMMEAQIEKQPPANRGGLIKKPHPKLGKVMAGASTALPLGAAAWNATR